MPRFWAQSPMTITKQMNIQNKKQKDTFISKQEIRLLNSFIELLLKSTEYVIID